MSETLYQRVNRRKFNLKAHIVLVTKYHKKLLLNGLNDFVKRACKYLAETKRWRIIAMETDKDHIHILLEYSTTERISDIISILKQRTTTYWLWVKYGNILQGYYWKRHIFWSDGYFVCSIGEASSATIQKYIESQG